MKKLNAVDRKFLISYVCLIVLCILRVSKWGKGPHAARLLILDDYYLSIVMTVVMFIVLFLLFMISLKRTENKSKNKVFYVIMMISIMLIPTYVHDNYMGSMDVYGIICGAVSLMLIIANRFEWGSIVLTAIAVFINPMCIFSVGIIVPITILYKAVFGKNKKELIICLILCVTEVLAFFVARLTGMFFLDAQPILDIKKMIVIMAFLIPFIITAIIMYYKLVKKSQGTERKLYYILSVFVGVPGFLIWSVAGDYTRAIVNLFICYGLWLLVILTNREGVFMSVTEGVCKEIKKWVPVNAVIIIYIAAIMIFWMCGVEEVDTEKLIELVVEK